ncbi:MAG: RecBCD enzyme subunit RecB [Candidatus Anoxychlamydiales bacterium]|nr:RecBCD enzyme subunit RecB [Candidatus Anoxychlamydiales bacterium]
MKIFDVLEKKSDIFGKKLLEASAGTGKTFAIEHLFARLLLEKDDFTIEQILVVTFTKAATKELKYRIRKNLGIAAEILKGKNVDKSINFNYLNSYINKKEKITKLQDAIDLFETAQIFTIHSFCFKALKEFAFEANIHLDINEEDDFGYIKKIIYDYLRYFIDLEKYSSEQIEILVNKNKDIDTLVFKIFQNLDKDFKVKNLNNFSNLLDDFNKNIKNFEKVDKDFEINNFENVSKNFKKKIKFTKQDYLFQLETLLKIVNSREASSQDFKNLLKTKLSIFEFLDEKNKKIKADDSQLSSFLQKAKNLLHPIIKEATDYKLLFYRLCIDISKKVDTYLETNELFTFDKILQKMQKATKTRAFKEKLSNRYKAVIIDEFQDTDKVQFDIFNTLFLTNPTTQAFYLIGDPKQSIYSFRKADLYTYLDAVKKIDEINYLDTNYRSTKSLIDSLNALLSDDFSKNWLKLPSIKKDLKYLPIKAGLDKAFDFQDNLASIHFFISEGNRIKKKWPTSEMEKKFFAYIRDEIVKLKEEQNFSDKSFAILIKDRYQAERLKSFLENFSIKAVTFKETSLKNSIALKAMIDFFEACIKPHDLSKVKLALLGPFINLQLQDLKDIDDKKFSKFLEKFYFFKSILIKKNLSIFFSHFFSTAFTDRTILENIASKKDENFYLELIYLIEIMLKDKSLHFNQILAFFDELKSLDDEDEKLKILKNASDGAQILTTFMSKGLEYDVVFAIGLASQNIESISNDLQEIDAEKMRQFYVAITRAKYRIYLPISIDLKEKIIQEGTCSVMEYYLSNILDGKTINKQNLLQKLDILKDKNLLSYSFVDDISFLAKKGFDKAPILKQSDIFTKSFQSRSIYSFSALSSDKNILKDEKKISKNIPIGPKVGELFHKILENILKKQSFFKEDIFFQIHDLIKDSILQPYEENINIIINNILKAPLANFCLKDVDFENIKPEVEFLFSFKNNYMKGFIDLVFEYNSKFYLIDWKSNFLGEDEKDYDKKNIENEMMHHNYYMQAAIYTKSLKRHIESLKKDFKKAFGGAFYIFLRGQNFSKDVGIYHFFPDLKILDKINLNNKNICLDR